MNAMTPDDEARYLAELLYRVESLNDEIDSTLERYEVSRLVMSQS